ncbi:MAG TPA: phosphodiester glycosidase family protein [Clostridia bacterium]|nr:phosphodiester glycosidase family protein [Clostridia bacterium]
MKKKNLRNTLFTKVLVLLIIASMVFPGTVFAKGATFAKGSVKLVESGQNIGPGTYYRNMNYLTPNGKFMVNMVECRYDTEYLKIETADGWGDGIINKPVSYQAQQKADKDRRVIGAVNGDFFDMTTIKGLTYGTSIINGEIRTAVKTSTVLGITDNGECFIDTLNMEGAVLYKDVQVPVSGVNRLRWVDQAMLYTPSFGKTTLNTTSGTDFVVKGVELPLKANKVYSGVIEKIIHNTKNTEIPVDGVVISIHGKVLKQFVGATAGDEISFSINLNKQNLDFAVAGAPRLLEDGKPSAELDSRTDSRQRHPRTAVGIKDNKLYMVTVDGRQPGYSDGMNLYEMTEFLLTQGVKDAINLDGGGSTTMTVRKQGDAVAKLVNNPSDGRERYVGNSLQLVSEAPLSEPAVLKFTDTSVKVFRNSTFKPTFQVMDKYYNVLTPDAAKVKYGADGKTAKIAKDGTYTSGSKAGKSYVDVFYGEAKNRMPVEIVDKVNTLIVTNDFVHLDPGEQVQLQVKAFDENGAQIIMSPSAVKWTVTGGIGTVDAKGVFTAGKKNGTGKISAAAGTAKAEVGAKNGRTPLIVADFGTLKNVEAKSIRSTAAVRHNQKDEPVKSGKISLRFDYNFENTEGTSAAYVTFKEPVKIIGKPIELGVWVYGDAGRHWLRGNYTNSAGERKVLDFTENGGLDWQGWKYVYAELPADEKYPIALEQLYLAETEQDRKNIGSIYFDDVMAIYKPDKDYYDPEIISELPDSLEELEKLRGIEGLEELQVQPQETGVIAADKGIGIDPASIRMYINDNAVKAKFEPETGKISYIPSDALSSGEYNVRITLKDKVGHKLNPEYTYTFIVE